ncbi:hypothetical protein XK97_14710 [Obesumbacterium proteus]|uniref:hypothetical protein n=1 Tax=Obesumbacterium proteus TaxID=82983 RepID=UPI0006217478|nr:hypothetical protein [Obesumbacterium proteus]KKI44224.1 hypothetical protein XK97_14710 [Obesumbacterium proteus]
MIGIFTAYPQNDLGLTVLKTGRNIFRRGTRVAVMSLNAAQEHLEAGILPDVNQIEALNPHFQSLYDSDRAFGLCGGTTLLDHYVLWLGRCQWLGCDAKYYEPFSVGDNGSVSVCRSCKNKLNIQEIPLLFEETARQNRIAFMLKTISEQIGQPDDRQLSEADIFVWCLRRNLQSQLPTALMHKLLGMKASASTGRECDIAPSYEPLELLDKRLSEVGNG